LADRGKSAARVHWQQAFLLTVAFVLALARANSAHVEAFNAELRTRVYTVNLFQTKADIELAPFFDLGKVSHEFTSNPVDNFHPAGGMGFRAIADPFVVGFVDVGYGDEGIAVFSGIDYPV
jgi:hypothetical protein